MLLRATRAPAGFKGQGYSGLLSMKLGRCASLS
jgi:hypothetical protein